MSSLQPSEGENTNQLQLEAAVCGNSFAEAALGFYQEAITAYNEGQDLEIYLKGLTFYQNMGWLGSVETGLSDEAVQLVLAGREQKDPKYNQRLGYSKDNGLDSLFRFDDAPRRTLTERYEDELGKNRKVSQSTEDLLLSIISGSDTYGLSERGIRVAGLNLDETFDEQGRRCGQVIELNTAMSRLGLILDQATMATYFANLLPTKAQGELYFNAIASPNQAGDALLLQLGGIKAQLEQYPEAYCDFLICEIANLHASGIIDIDKNAQDVLLLLNDKTLFPSSSDLMDLYDEFDCKRLNWINGNSLKTALNNALIKAERPDLLIATGVQSLEQVQEAAKLAEWIIKADRDQLKWREKHRLRKIAGTMIEIMGSYIEFGGDPGDEPCFIILDPKPENLAAMLALAIAGDQKKFKYYYGAKSARITPLTFVKEQPNLYFRDVCNELLASNYTQHFPLEALSAGADFEDVLAPQALLATQAQAEEVYEKVANDAKKAPITKMLSAITMAGAFTHETGAALRIEAACLTNLDALELEAGIISELDSLVAMSARRQELSHELQTLQERISQVAGTDRRQALLVRAQAVQDLISSSSAK
jgi:hypothetical protein